MQFYLSTNPRINHWRFPASYVSLSERKSHDSLGSWRKDEDTQFHLENVVKVFGRNSNNNNNNNNNKTWIKGKQISNPNFKTYVFKHDYEQKLSIYDLDVF